MLLTCSHSNLSNNGQWLDAAKHKIKVAVSATTQRSGCTHYHLCGIDSLWNDFVSSEPTGTLIVLVGSQTHPNVSTCLQKCDNAMTMTTNQTSAVWLWSLDVQQRQFRLRPVAPYLALSWLSAASPLCQAKYPVASSSSALHCMLCLHGIIIMIILCYVAGVWHDIFRFWVRQ